MQKFDSAWVRGLWSQGRLCWTTQRAILSESLACMELLFFLQQARMFCPIFLSTIPPYIRPVISWVVTVRAHSASALTLLHQPAEGEQWGEGERKTLSYFSVPERHEVSVWCEREEGGRVRKWEGEVGGRGVDASRSYHIHRFWGSFESLLHKTLSRFSSTQISFWKRGKTLKQWNNMQVQGRHRSGFTCRDNLWKYETYWVIISAESADSGPEGCRTLNALSKSELLSFSLLCNSFFLLVFQAVNIMLLTRSGHWLIVIWLRVSRRLTQADNSSRIAALQDYHIK